MEDDSWLRLPDEHDLCRRGSICYIPKLAELLGDSFTLTRLVRHQEDQTNWRLICIRFRRFSSLAESAWDHPQHSASHAHPQFWTSMTDNPSVISPKCQSTVGVPELFRRHHRSSDSCIKTVMVNDLVRLVPPHDIFPPPHNVAASWTPSPPSRLVSSVYTCRPTMSGLSALPS